MLNIIVCVKQVVDPEAPASAYKIDDVANMVLVKGVPPVLNPFDENALEAALRIKDNHKSNVTVLSMGSNLSKAVLKKCYAAGADDLILLEDDAYKELYLDSYSTALALTAAIRKIGAYDIILTGRQAADTSNGVVGSYIAEALCITSVTSARRIEFNKGALKIDRVLSDGYEVIEASLPVLVTVSNELGELRSIALPQILAAQKKPITVWKDSDLNVDVSPQNKNELLKVFIPSKEENCKFIDGQTEEEKGENLANTLKEAGMF